MKGFLVHLNLICSNFKYLNSFNKKKLIHAMNLRRHSNVAIMIQFFIYNLSKHLNYYANYNFIHHCSPLFTDFDHHIYPLRS